MSPPPNVSSSNELLILVYFLGLSSSFPLSHYWYKIQVDLNNQKISFWEYIFRNMHVEKPKGQSFENYFYLKNIFTWKMTCEVENLGF